MSTRARVTARLDQLLVNTARLKALVVRLPTTLPGRWACGFSFGWEFELDVIIAPDEYAPWREALRGLGAEPLATHRAAYEGLGPVNLHAFAVDGAVVRLFIRGAAAGDAVAPRATFVQGLATD